MPVKKPDTLVHTKDTARPDELRQEQAPQHQVEGGIAEGVEAGVTGGQPGAQPGGHLGSEVVPFGEGMTRPELISGPSKTEYAGAV